MTLYDCGADSYVHKDLDGWNVCMDKSLFKWWSWWRTLGERTEDLLLEDIRHIEGVLEPATFAYLRENTPIYVEKNSSFEGAAVYHPDSTWLIDNDHPAYWEKSVMLDTQLYLDAAECQPAQLLHVLAYSWLDQYLGDYEPLEDAYENALSEGTYENVENCQGDIVNKAYALMGKEQYFAELTEALFWKNNYYPFNNAELYSEDPVGAEMVESAWHQPFLVHSLLDDTSDWHVADSSAVVRVDSFDGRGQEIQFPHHWDIVYAQASLADYEIPDGDLGDLINLNFDVKVRGGAPIYSDKWWVKVEAFDASDNWLAEHLEHGVATEAGEDVQVQLQIARENWDNVDHIDVQIHGYGAESEEGSYGAIFRGMNLYLSER